VETTAEDIKFLGKISGNAGAWIETGAAEAYSLFIRL
jgi:hypothetical protein